MKTNSKHKSEVRTVLLGCTTKPWLKSDQELLVCYRLSLGWGIWTKGLFTNYVYKRRGVGGQKNQLFVNFYTIENVNGGG